MKFIDPRIDFAFRKIFGSEDAKEILVSFLEALLGLSDDRRLREVTILNPFMAPRIQGMKDSILDVRCVDHRGVQYIVEMQVRKVRAFLKRIQYNAAKAYVNQIASAEEYPRLNQIIAVTITDFTLFPEFGHPVSRHETRESLTGEPMLQEILYYFIELPKFTRTLYELETVLDKWIYFIKSAASLEEIPATLQGEPFHHAFEKARVACMDREELERYDQAAMAIADARGEVELAVEEAEKRGKQRGKAALLLRLLHHRFGQTPDWVSSQLETATSGNLDTWSDRAFTAPNLEAVFQ